MSLLQNKDSLFQIPYLQHSLTLYNKGLSKKNKVIALSVAVAMMAVYMVRERVFKPPKHLGHIPYFGYFSIIKSLMKGESHFDRGYNVNLPFVDSSKNGLYMEPGRDGWEIHISNPEDAKRILLKHEQFPKSNVMKSNENTLLTKFIGGKNVFVLSGHEWKLQRKVTSPAFRRSMPVKLFGKLSQELFKTMEKMDHDTVNVSDLLLRSTLDAIGKAGFGFDFHATSDLNSKWVTVYNDINLGIRDLKYFVFPILEQKLLWLFPKRQQLHQKLDTFLTMLDEVIQNKRNLLKQGHVQNDDLEENERDLLTLMIESEMRGESILTDEELKANMCLFFFAGHDTTSSALSFALYHLAKHPEIQQRAREEVLNILGDEPSDILPTLEDTKNMTYINQIIKETLRINCPSPRVIPRQVTQDTILSNTFVPKGTKVTVNIFNIHHSSKYWTNGDQFDPDRFAQDGEGIRGSGEGMSWLAFGNGARQCIGMNFSLIEQRVMLSMLLRKFTWTLPKDSKHIDKVITGGFPIVSPTELEITFKKRY